MLVLVSLANLANKTQLTPVQIIFSITPVCVSLVPRLLHSGTQIEVVQAWRAWYFFSYEKHQR